MLIRKIRNRLRGYAMRYMKWRSIPSLSWWRTIFINFYFLPFQQAKKLPIYVYGKLRITKMMGEIEINYPENELFRGMIRINQIFEASGTADGDSELIIGKGKIIFSGFTRIGRNSKILLWGGGTIEIGKNVFINHGANIACANYIKIGKDIRIGPQCQIFDTDFHYTYSPDKRIVKRNNGKVELGHHCWIGARSTIMKGVTLPPYTTVSSNSLVNKSVAEEERCLIGGMPAKLIRVGFGRIFNFKYECEIADYFERHPEIKTYELTEPLEAYD